MTNVTFQSISTLHLIRMQTALGKIGLPVDDVAATTNNFNNIRPIVTEGAGYSLNQLNRMDQTFKGTALTGLGIHVNLLV